MRRAGDVQRLQPIIAADAVFLVHDQIALGDLRRLGDELIGALAPPRRAADALAQQVLLADQRQPIGDEAALDPSVTSETEPAGLRRTAAQSPPGRRP